LADLEWELEQAIIDRDSIKNRVLLLVLGALIPLFIVNVEVIILLVTKFIGNLKLL